ncbi:SoxR reducing system RseC family protein [Gammaproteobacteria bacterium]|nr:SoxR reducing system RseC family protein [Gammaproteobacteria bacterium]
MLTETAVVTRRDGDRVELELQRSSACDHCELNQGCGTGALSRLFGRRSRPLIIKTDRDCKPGDRVLLELPESALVRASLLLYGLPLLGLLLGGLLAALLAVPEWLVVGIALFGLFVGFKLATRTTQRLEQGGQTPYIRVIQVNP